MSCKQAQPCAAMSLGMERQPKPLHPYIVCSPYSHNSPYWDTMRLSDVSSAMCLRLPHDRTERTWHTERCNGTLRQETGSSHRFRVFSQTRHSHLPFIMQIVIFTLGLVLGIFLTYLILVGAYAVVAVQLWQNLRVDGFIIREHTNFQDWLQAVHTTHLLARDFWPEVLLICNQSHSIHVLLLPAPIYSPLSYSLPPPPPPHTSPHHPMPIAITITIAIAIPPPTIFSMRSSTRQGHAHSKGVHARTHTHTHTHTHIN